MSEILSYVFDDETERAIADGVIKITLPEPMKHYEIATLYFSDGEKPLCDYLRIATRPVIDGNAEYKISGKRAIPKGATHLMCLLSDEYGVLKEFLPIPEEKPMEEKEVLFEYFAMSDPHCGDYWNNANNRIAAFEDVKSFSPDFVTINGDIGNNTQREEYEQFEGLMKKYFSEIPAFITNGNHDIKPHLPGLEPHHDALISEFDERIACVESLGFKVNRDGNKMYYSADKGDIHLIFMSVALDVVDDVQLEWVDNELSKHDDCPLPTFVFCHYPLGNTVVGQEATLYGQVNDAKLREILNRHGNVMFNSAHTHSNLDSDRQRVVVGNMKDCATHYNSGSLCWTGSDRDVINNAPRYEKYYVTGQYVQVYKDSLLISARQFGERKFSPKGLFYVKF